MSSSDAPACGWCGAGLVQGRPGRWCSKRCRQSAFRMRRRQGRVATRPGEDGPGVFVYADPPYLGRASRYYGGEEDPFAGEAAEVDHAALVAGLERRRVAGEIRGWALSCSTDSLPFLFRLQDDAGRFLIPGDVRTTRVATWAKPRQVPKLTFGVHARTEKVVVVGGRKARPGVPDWLEAQPARGGGELMGRKPIAFCAWLFDLLGMMRGDVLEDVFPGTGVVGRAWAVLQLQGVAEVPGDGSRVVYERVASSAAVADEGGLG